MQMQTIPRYRISPVASQKDQFGEYLTHPVKLYHFVWDNTIVPGVVDLSTNLIKDWVSGLPATLANKIQRFYYFKGTIRIRVVVQGAAQAYGQMLLTFTPRLAAPMVGAPGGAGDKTYVSSDPTVNLKVVPHIVLDPSKNDTYELDLPVCTPTGFYQIGTTNPHGSYDLARYCVNKLRSGTAVTPVINVCVYMSLVDVAFEGMTMSLSSDIVSEKKMSNILSSISSISGVFAPAAGPFGPAVTVFSEVAGAASSVLRFFGYAKPVQGDAHAFILNRTADNYSHVEGNSSMNVLGATTRQTVSISPSYGNGSMDEMSISYIVSKPGLIVRDFVVDSTYASEAPVFSIPVSPQVTYSATYLTPMAGVANACSFWSGDLKFRFEFVASAFTRATFLISWDPYAYSSLLADYPTVPNALVALENTTVQVVGNTAVEIVVPYKSFMPVLHVNPTADYTYSITTKPNGSENYTNGMMYLHLINPVVDNGGAQAVAVNIYVSSDNLALFGASTNFIAGKTYVGSDTLSTDICPAADVRFGAKTILSDLHFRVTGDPIHSVKDLVSRMTEVYSFSSGTVTAATRIYQIQADVFAPRTTSNAAKDPTATTFLAWIAPAFVGYRGGLKFTMAADITNDVSNIHAISYYADRRLNSTSGSGTFQNPVTDGLAGAFQIMRDYAWTQVNSLISSRLDYSAPMMIGLDFMPTRYKVDVCNSYMIAVAQLNAGLNTNFYLGVGSGASDDATFTWFIGFPPTN